MAMPILSDAADAEIERIAVEILDVDIQAFKANGYRGRHDCTIGELFRALEQAYLAGMVDHHRKQ